MQLAQMEEYRARNHYHQTVLRSLEVIVSIKHHIQLTCCEIRSCTAIWWLRNVLSSIA